jgi:hypothetical protein
MCPKLAEKLSKKIVIETILENGGEMSHSELRETSIKKWLKRYTSTPDEDHLDRARFLVVVGICDLKDEKMLSRETPSSNWKIISNNRLTSSDAVA